MMVLLLEGSSDLTVLHIENNRFDLDFSIWSFSQLLMLLQVICKVRANYAEVGSATDPYNVFNTFNIELHLTPLLLHHILLL
jgi:hypothetical protein